jgi:hypothetical protein
MVVIPNERRISQVASCAVPMPLVMFSTSLKITSNHAAIPGCLRLSKLIVENEGNDLNVATRQGRATKFAFRFLESN